MTRAVIGLALLLLTGRGAALAQLGEAPAEIARRFGPPIRTNARVYQHQIIGGPETSGDVHLQGSLFIRIVYGPGGAVQAEFSPREGALPRPAVDELLAAAADGSRWQETRGGGETIRFFRRVDGQALASWTTGADGSLLIAADGAGEVWQKLLLEER